MYCLIPSLPTSMSSVSLKCSHEPTDYLYLSAGNMHYIQQGKPAFYTVVMQRKDAEKSSAENGL